MNKKNIRVGNNPLDWIKNTAIAVESEAGSQEPSKSQEDQKEKIGSDYFIPFSAKTKESLAQKIRDMEWWLKKQGLNCSIGDIALTLLAGRGHFTHRSCLVVSSIEELAEKISEIVNTGSTSGYMTGEAENEQPQGASFTGNTEELGRRYVKGYMPNWKELYKNADFRRIPMPTYPFARQSYMVTVLEEKAQETVKKAELMYFRTYWEEIKENITFPQGNTLVFGTVEALPESFIKVRPGLKYNKLQKDLYEIDPNSKEDYVALFEELKATGREPRNILHLWNSAREKLDSETSKSIYSAFNIVKALKKTKIKALKRFTYVYNSNPFAEAVPGCFRSLLLLLPGTDFSSLGIYDQKIDVVRVALAEVADDRKYTFNEKKYEDGKLYVKKAHPISLEKKSAVRLKDKGVYLLTGGAGALGFIFARYLAQKYNARLVLTGRSPLDAEKQKMLQELENLGGRALYIQGDVVNKEDMKRVFAAAEAEFGGIDGILHSAGNLTGGNITERETVEIEETLAPKLQGTVILDELSKYMNLDFFVMFSSMSSVLGDFGQCDYAVGNRFMDSYVGVREQKMRSGTTIAINWPIWRDGGMHIDKESELLYLKSSGMDYLESDAGIKAFEDILQSGINNAMVLVGDPERVVGFLGIRGQADMPQSVKPTVQKVIVAKAAAEIDIEAALIKNLIKLASRIVGMTPDGIDIGNNLGNYGFDSITLLEFAEELGKAYGIEVSPTVFFSHSSIKRLTGHLLEEFGTEIKGLYNGEGSTVEEVEEEIHDTGYVAPVVKEYTPERYIYTAAANEPVAVIGISGIMPGSDNMEEFWENMCKEKNMSTEIPEERWDWKKYYSENLWEKDKINSKWGCFIRDIDKFDAQFYQISPKEAEFMDLQQRLFLLNSWRAIEDAGYKPSELWGRKIGVYVGVQFSDYQDILSKNTDTQPQTAIGNAQAIISNRVSFLLNLRGPSESIDTACASSSVAVHRAVKSLQMGESEMAIAGGVNLLISPNSYLLAGKLAVLSVDGKCKTFDKRANGYVRGEGVGVLLLKPLSKAVADGDHIHAVIKGSAQNHGGRANSLTAPNPDAQAELLVSAYEDAGIDIDTVTYIEAHGTGTELGDPIEIDGLKKAFGELVRRGKGTAKRKNFCGVGSVKTNIGHLEPASGIAGILKVILCMKHKKLLKLLNFEDMNPYINLKDSPFYVVNTTKDWERLKDENGNEIPRRAGVSSFGFGGSNAHIVLEEYDMQNINAGVKAVGQQIAVISAKSKDRLREYASGICQFLSKPNKSTMESLENIVYTLQVGREEMEERLALVVSDEVQLVDKLKQYLNGKNEIENLFEGNTKDNRIKSDLLLKSIEGGEYIKNLIKSNRLDSLAYLWTLGAAIDWNLLNTGLKGRRIPMTTYPFAKERYWMPIAQESIVKPERAADTVRLHPLIGSNTSTLIEQKYSVTFYGSEFFLADHVIAKSKVLPGVAYIEMAREAVELSGESRVDKVMNILWSRPLVVDDVPQNVSISIYPDEGGIEYEVYSTGADGQRIIYGQGRAVLKVESAGSRQSDFIDINAIKQRCSTFLSGKQCYAEFDAIGFSYGPRFSPIVDLYGNDTESISYLELPALLEADYNIFGLHPTLLDGALQSAFGISGMRKMFTDSIHLPFGIDEIEILKSIPKKCWAHVVATQLNFADDSGLIKFNVKIADEAGAVCTVIKGFSIKGQRKPDMESEKVLSLLNKLHRGDIDVNEVEQLLGSVNI